MTTDYPHFRASPAVVNVLPFASRGDFPAEGVPAVGERGGVLYLARDTRTLYFYIGGEYVETSESDPAAELYVNVVDFGAVGDGTTDDTAAFNAALDAINAGTIFIPAGTYILENWTVNKSNITVMGEGSGSILKLKAGDYGDTTGLNTVGAIKVYSGTADQYLHRVRVYNLACDGNRANVTGTSLNNIECIDFTYTENSVIDTCWVYNAMSDGVDIDYGRRCLVNTVYADDCHGWGVHFSLSSEECGAINCIASNCGSSNNRGGFDTYKSTRDCYYDACAAYNCVTGFQLDGLRSRATGCKANNNDDWGFLINNSNATNSIISSCSGFNNLQNASSIANSDFEIASGVQGVCISNCVSENSSHRAFRMNASNTCRIIGCRATGSGSHALRIWDSISVIVSDCYFEPPSGEGIPTIGVGSGGASANNFVLSNVVVSGTSTELDLEILDTEDCRITNCRFEASGDVLIDSTSHRCQMSTCNLNGNLTADGRDFSGTNLRIAGDVLGSSSNGFVQYKDDFDGAVIRGVKNPTQADDVATKSYVDGQPGPEEELEYVATVYLSDFGDNSNTGRNPGHPVASLQLAIEKCQSIASERGLGQDDGVRIVILGAYDRADDTMLNVDLPCTLYIQGWAGSALMTEDLHATYQDNISIEPLNIEGSFKSLVLENVDIIGRAASPSCIRFDGGVITGVMYLNNVNLYHTPASDRVMISATTANKFKCRNTNVVINTTNSNFTQSMLFRLQPSKMLDAEVTVTVNALEDITGRIQFFSTSPHTEDEATVYRTRTHVNFRNNPGAYTYTYDAPYVSSFLPAIQHEIHLHGMPASLENGFRLFPDSLTPDGGVGSYDIHLSYLGAYFNIFESIVLPDAVRYPSVQVTYSAKPSENVSLPTTGSGYLAQTHRVAGAALPVNAIQRQAADSAALGGNARGQNALDMQLVRSSADQVASGINSSIVSAANSKSDANASSVISSWDATIESTAARSAIVAGNNITLQDGDNQLATGNNAIGDYENALTIGGGITNGMVSQSHIWAPSVFAPAQSLVNPLEPRFPLKDGHSISISGTLQGRTATATDREGVALYEIKFTAINPVGESASWDIYQGVSVAHKLPEAFTRVQIVPSFNSDNSTISFLINTNDQDMTDDTHWHGMFTVTRMYPSS